MSMGPTTCHICGRATEGNWEPHCTCHEEAEALRAKLTASEAEVLALRCKPIITSYSELDTRWQELVAAHDQLRAKLQAAELLNEEYRIQLLMADKISGEQRSRAEAAEAEIKELQSELKNWAENGFQYDWEQECIRLEAEVARLREALEELIEVSDLRGDIDEIPHPCDDPKLWTARLISAWDNARAALEVKP